MRQKISFLDPAVKEDDSDLMALNLDLIYMNYSKPSLSSFGYLSHDRFLFAQQTVRDALQMVFHDIHGLDLSGRIESDIGCLVT